MKFSAFALGTVVLSSVSCNAHKAVPPEADATSTAVKNVELCPGGAAPALLLRSLGGGQAYNGQNFYGENGHSYLLIDKDCRFWLQSYKFGAPLLTGILGEAERRELVEQLHLAELDRLAGRYVLNANDASELVLQFGGLAASLGGAGEGRPAKDGEWLSEGAVKVHTALSALAQPAPDAGGRLATSRWPSTDASPAGEAVPWPLAEPPSTFAVPLEALQQDRLFERSSRIPTEMITALRSAPTPSSPLEPYLRTFSYQSELWVAGFRNASPYETAEGRLVEPQ